MRGRSLVVGHLPAHINDSGPRVGGRFEILELAGGGGCVAAPDANLTLEWYGGRRPDGKMGVR